MEQTGLPSKSEKPAGLTKLEAVTPNFDIDKMREAIKAAINKNALLKGLLLSTGYYGKFTEHLPIVIDILLGDERGVKVLKELNFFEYVEDKT